MKQHAIHLCTGTELVQITTRLRQDDISRHGRGESVKEDHQLVDVHASIDGFLSVDSHDCHADKQVEGGGLVVGPASLPDGEGIHLLELSLEADQQPAVAEHERQTALCLLQVGEKVRDEHLYQDT